MSAWSRFDDGVYYVEKGIVTTALLTLAVVFFYDIISVEVIAEDNAFDRLVYRLSGYGPFDRPDEAFRTWVKTWVTPPALGLMTFGLSFLGVVARDQDRKIRTPMRLLMAAGITVGAYAILQGIARVPSPYVCVASLVLILVAYFRIAVRDGKTTLFALTWAVGIWPFIWVIMQIDQGYAWAQDLGKLLIMWIGFAGASMATRERKHIRIDFVRKALPASLENQYNAFSYAVTIVFCVVLGALGWAYFLEELEAGSTLSALPVPGWAIVLPIPLALSVMALRFSSRFVLALRGEEAALGGEIEIDSADGGQA